MESRKRVVLEAATLNFPSIGAGLTAELTIPSQDAAPGGIVTIGQPASFPDGLIATAYVDTAGDIVIRVHNTTAAAIDPGAGTAVAAAGTLTMDTQPTDADDYTIDVKTYVFEDSLTDVNGNVNVGGTLAQAKLNLVAALDLSGTAGTDYALSMTAHPTVNAAAFIADDAVLTALVAGRAGNDIATTENFTAGTNVFDAATLGTTVLGEDAAEASWKVGLIL